MALAATSRGARIRFLDDYLSLDPEARTTWIRESAGGCLIEDKRSPADAVEDLLRRTARIHGDEVRATGLPRGTTLITWGDPPPDAHSLGVGGHVRVDVHGTDGHYLVEQASMQVAHGRFLGSMFTRMSIVSQNGRG